MLGAVVLACASLHGSFAVVPNSAGAGNIVYALRLRNDGARACTLPGLPHVRLLGTGGRSLPTHASGHARAVTIRPGGTFRATARFSPDVPGPGESTLRACEPVAHFLRLGRVVVPIRPPTRVCEHGQLVFR
jgi:hypothetical protein